MKIPGGRRLQGRSGECEASRSGGERTGSNGEKKLVKGKEKKRGSREKKKEERSVRFHVGLSGGWRDKKETEVRWETSPGEKRA